MPSHPPDAVALGPRRTRRQSLDKCWVQSSHRRHGNEAGERRVAETLARLLSAPLQGRTTEVSLLDRRGPDKCWAAAYILQITTLPLYAFTTTPSFIWTKRQRPKPSSGVLGVAGVIR